MVQNDPREMPPNVGDYGPANGIMSAFVPTGSLGLLATLFVGILAALAAGLAHGIWLFAAIVSLPILILLMRRGLKKELRRDDRRGYAGLRHDGSLPPNAELSETDRRTAMRHFSIEYEENDDES